MTPAWETQRGRPPAQGPYTQRKLDATVLVNIEMLRRVLAIRIVKEIDARDSFLPKRTSVTKMCRLLLCICHELSYPY